MSRGFNWEAVNRQRRVDFRPSQRSQPATPRQIDYILGLSQQKGQPRPRVPKTKKGASDMIERLLALPDALEAARSLPTQTQTPIVEPPNAHQELVIELRERFPGLTPMTVHSLVQLFGQIDAIGMAFTFDSLAHEDVPDDPDELLLYILARFLAEFSAVSSDDEALVG